MDQASDANPALTLVILDLSHVTMMPSMALGLLVQIVHQVRGAPASG